MLQKTMGLSNGTRAALTIPEVLGEPNVTSNKMVFQHGVVPSRTPCILCDLCHARRRSRE